ncbi:ABC transporter permease [Vibrio inusitatus NBRC 102082]|uniref:ABC transporter permease n=1 Tax=Vibrio inusitatus NBRC 102082 TaxID=1219070 RepID=A0A4Y3HT54_9VIBR|nr:ABC transporter permease [Vibrio inusitatus]GEA50266.1 ABC transporter permease [Vibrio inusitatus NBRC 102082]
MRYLNNMQKLGVALVTILISLVVIEALFWGNDPAIQNLQHVFSGPSIANPLGTDQFGRCNLARLSSALQTSLFMVLIAVITSSVLGVALGVLAGWKQGWIDRLLSSLVNVVLALPGLILILLFGALVPGSYFILYVAISLVLWVEYFRVIRAKTMALIQLPEIQAAELFGFGPWLIFKRHLWPSFRKDVFTLACFGAGTSVLALASVGFVYVGLRPPHAELGLMMVELFPYYSDAPWVLLQPLIAVVLMVLGFHLIAGEKSE